MNKFENMEQRVGITQRSPVQMSATAAAAAAAIVAALGGSSPATASARDEIRISNLHAQTANQLRVANSPAEATEAPHRVQQAQQSASDEIAHEIDERISAVRDTLAKELSDCVEVLAVIAEPIDGQRAVYVTTFASPLDESVRERIYNAELKLLDEFHDMAFDFHARTPEIVDGRPKIPPAPNAQGLWLRP